MDHAVLKRAGPRLPPALSEPYAAGVPTRSHPASAWEVLHAVHGWAQVEMLHAGECRTGPDPLRACTTSPGPAGTRRTR